VETSPSTVTVQVADNGPGIPDHDRAALFTPDLERQHRFGLYLVKTLVNYYDGEVEVAETGPTGTVMRVELPRAEPP
jgi:signal transduction histidine kinase